MLLALLVRSKTVPLALSILCLSLTENSLIAQGLGFTAIYVSRQLGFELQPQDLKSKVVTKLCKSLSRHQGKKMTPEMRKWLKIQIECKLKRSPGCSLIDLKEFIREDASHNWNAVNKKTLHNFLDRNMKKFQQTGNLKRKPGSGGENAISLRKVNRIVKLSKNKVWASSR